MSVPKAILDIAKVIKTEVDLSPEKDSCIVIPLDNFRDEAGAFVGKSALDKVLRRLREQQILKTINISDLHNHILPLQSDKLELQVEQELEGLTILPEFKGWALEVLNENNDHEIEDRTKIYEMQHANLVTTQKELDNLTKMRYRELINDDTFIKERNDLQSKITEMKEKLHHTESRAERWLELTEKTFNFAQYARSAFIKGGLELKKEILMSLGYNTQIKAGKLSLETMGYFIPIKNGASALQKQYLGLELGKKSVTKAQTEALASIRAQWRATVESNHASLSYRARQNHDNFCG